MSNPDVTTPKGAKPSDPSYTPAASVAEPEDSTPEDDEIDEGDRPSAEHGSVEGLDSGDRPGGMAGEG